MKTNFFTIAGAVRVRMCVYEKERGERKRERGVIVTVMFPFGNTKLGV